MCLSEHSGSFTDGPESLAEPMRGHCDSPWNFGKRNLFVSSLALKAEGDAVRTAVAFFAPVC